MEPSLGWIKLHRSMLKWGWMSHPNTLSLFIHLLLEANLEDKIFMGHDVKRGDVVFGLNAWSDKLGLTLRQTRTALDHLKSTSEVTIKSNNKFSIITVTNFNEYQSSDNQNDKRPTFNRQTTDIQPTTPKEVKNVRIKEDKKNTVSVGAFELIDEFQKMDEDFRHVAQRIPQDKQKKLSEEYNIVDVFRILYAIGGWKKYKTDVKDVYLTAKNWLRKDGILPNSEKPNGGKDGKKWNDF